MKPDSPRLRLDEFRSRLESWWSEKDAAAIASKDSARATRELIAAIREMGPDERRFAEQVIAEWLLSNDEGRRFDALAAVRELEIQSAVPALRELEGRLGGAVEPGALFERNRVRAIRTSLAVGAERTRRDSALHGGVPRADAGGNRQGHGGSAGGDRTE